MCTDTTQTVHSEGFKGFTMEGEWEEDSNCQDITRHQSLLTASMGFYSLSVAFHGKCRMVSKWIADSQ